MESYLNCFGNFLIINDSWPRWIICRVPQLLHDLKFVCSSATFLHFGCPQEAVAQQHIKFRFLFWVLKLIYMLHPKCKNVALEQGWQTQNSLWAALRKNY
jgi:hypothetical protein